MDDQLLEQTKYLLRVNKIKPGFVAGHVAARATVAGQNFLICDDILETIILAADIKSNDNVLEIGPGLGVMTAELIKRANKVLAVEYDKQLIPLLNKLVSINNNLELINEDILQVNNQEIIDRLGKDYMVVANIPYQITSKIIKKFLTFKLKPSSLILLVQKEVAERIVATPGQLSKLAISVQFYASAEIVKLVPKECFWPEPKVDSAIIKIELNNHYLKIVKQSQIDEKRFWSVVRSGFAGKRKTLANNLSNSLHIERSRVVDILKTLSLDKNIRAQELSIEQWIEIVKLVPSRD